MEARLYTWSITWQSWRHNGLACNAGIFFVWQKMLVLCLCLCITLSTLFDFVSVHLICFLIFLGKVLLHGNAGISRRLVKNHLLYRHLAIHVIKDICTEATAIHCHRHPTNRPSFITDRLCYYYCYCYCYCRTHHHKQPTIKHPLLSHTLCWYLQSIHTKA